MAADLNIVTLVARLARDPELRTTSGGTSVCELRVAYNVSKKTADGWDDEGHFVNVTVWGNQGEAIAKNLTKGQRIGVTGRLQHRTWEGEHGRREAHSIVADRVQYLTPKSEAQGGSASPAARPATAAPVAAPANDDDIPF